MSLFVVSSTLSIIYLVDNFVDKKIHIFHLSCCQFTVSLRNQKIIPMIYITLMNEFIQDLYADAIESSVYVSLEPVERNYLTNSPADYKHHLTKISFGQVKPKTKPTLRPRCRSFLLASSNANSSDDPLGYL